jgi:DNA-binding NarL/FixJ family response regulator
VLRHLRQSRRCANTAVIVSSTSTNPREQDEVMRLGANRYFIKPSELDEFMKLSDLIRELITASSV